MAQSGAVSGGASVDLVVAVNETLRVYDAGGIAGTLYRQILSGSFIAVSTLDQMTTGETRGWSGPGVFRITMNVGASAAYIVGGAVDDSVDTDADGGPSGAFDSIARGLAARGISSGQGVGFQIAPPQGFGWDFDTFPLRIYKDGPRHFRTDYDPRTAIPSDVWNGPVFYAAYNGNNANAGTSPSTAVRSLWKLKQLLEASPAPGGIFMAMVDPDLGYTLWDRNNDLNDTGGAGGTQGTAPTKPYALMSYGGVSYMGAVPNLTWTYDATSKTYSVTRSLVTAVADFSAYNRWGIFKRLPKITAGADLAATRTLVGAAPGSYALTAANDLVVRLENDAVVSDQTVRVMLGAADALKLGTVSCYISGFALVGGTQAGVVNGAQAATRNIVMDDCDASFAGIDGGNGGRNNYAFDNMTGLVVLRRCKSSSSHADNYNWHMQSGAMYGLMIDCEGIDAGRAGASPVNLSNQFVTVHERAKIISLNLRGLFASGGLVRNIHESEHWDLGSEYGFDRGDTRYAGGTQVSTGVAVNDTAKYWGDCITVRGCQQTFYATSAAEIRLRDPIEIGGLRGGSGLITKY